MEREYTREQVDAVAKAAERDDYMKLRYGPNETGWAIRLDGDKAVIANVPLEDGIGLWDVVSVVEGDDGWPTWKDVIFRRWTHKTALKYDEGETGEETQKIYSRISNTLREAGMASEGMYSGSCMINHREDDDIVKTLVDAGIERSSFSADWRPDLVQLADAPNADKE